MLIESPPPYCKLLTSSSACFIRCIMVQTSMHFLCDIVIHFCWLYSLGFFKHESYWRFRRACISLLVWYRHNFWLVVFYGILQAPLSLYTWLFGQSWSCFLYLQVFEGCTLQSFSSVCFIQKLSWRELNPGDISMLSNVPGYLLSVVTRFDCVTIICIAEPEYMSFLQYSTKISEQRRLSYYKQLDKTTCPKRLHSTIDTCWVTERTSVETLWENIMNVLVHKEWLVKCH